MVLAGIWYGKEHPVFNTFMMPIVDILKKLEKDGKQLASVFLKLD